MPESIFTEDIQILQGISPKKAEVLAEGGVLSFRDLLHYFPRRYLDRSTVTAIRDLQENGPAVTVVGTVRVSGGRAGQANASLRTHRRGRKRRQDEVCLVSGRQLDPPAL